MPLFKGWPCHKDGCDKKAEFTVQQNDDSWPWRDDLKPISSCREHFFELLPAPPPDGDYVSAFPFDYDLTLSQHRRPALELPAQTAGNGPVTPEQPQIGTSTPDADSEPLAGQAVPFWTFPRSEA